MVFIPEGCITGLDPDSLAANADISFNNGKTPEQPVKDLTANRAFLDQTTVNTSTAITDFKVGSDSSNAGGDINFEIPTNRFNR